METLIIFSAGAAQALVSRLVSTLEQEGHPAVSASYGAVHFMKSRLLAGEAADVIVLTDTLIDELCSQALVTAGSRVDLGAVGTGIAVRAGCRAPQVDSPDALRAALLASDRVVCPDPAVATAGKVLLQVIDALGISAQMQPRLAYCASGYDAMASLARGAGEREVGFMQMTEIVASTGVALAGPLPAALQSSTTYSAGLCAHSRQPARAQEFIRRLTAEPRLLREAGFAGACTAA